MLGFFAALNTGLLGRLVEQASSLLDERVRVVASVPVGSPSRRPSGSPPAPQRRADRASGGLPSRRKMGPGEAGHGSATHAFCNQVVASIDAANKNVGGTSAGGAICALAVRGVLRAGQPDGRWKGCQAPFRGEKRARHPCRAPDSPRQTGWLPALKLTTIATAPTASPADVPGTVLCSPASFRSLNAPRTIPLPGNRRAQSPRVPCSGSEAGRRSSEQRGHCSSGLLR